MSPHNQKSASLLQVATCRHYHPPAHCAPPLEQPPAAVPAQQLLLAVVDLWLDKFDSIGNPAARKLSALALCALLPAPLPGLLERLELIATHITSVWFEVGGWLTYSRVAGPWIAGGGRMHGLSVCCSQRGQTCHDGAGFRQRLHAALRWPSMLRHAALLLECAGGGVGGGQRRPGSALQL